MSAVECRLVGAENLAKTLMRLGDGATKPVKKAMKIGMLLVRDTILKSLRAENKSGEFYFRGKYPNYIVHQASAPGEAPASDTGELIRGITLPLEVEDGEEFGVVIISKAPYSSELEYGTTRMAARPYMTPAFLEHKEYMRELVRLAVQRVFKQYGLDDTP